MTGPVGTIRVLVNVHRGNFAASKKSGDSSDRSRSGSPVVMCVASSTAVALCGITEPESNVTLPPRIGTVPVTRSTQMCATLNCVLDLTISMARGLGRRGKQRARESEAGERRDALSTQC